MKNDHVESQASIEHRIAIPAIGNNVSADGCNDAIVCLAWVWNGERDENNQSHLVFASADLVPSEQPLSDLVPQVDGASLGKTSGHRLYVASAVCSATTAIDWYDAIASRGDWLGKWVVKHRPSCPVQLQDILNEPRWPKTAQLAKTKAVRFSRNREHGTRSNHTLCGSPVLPGLLSEHEARKLREKLKAALRLDLEASPHLWQSAHFFQPRPLLRHFHTRLASNPDQSDRAILINLVPRKGASLSGISIEIRENRVQGSRVLASFRPASPFLRLEVDEDVEQISLRALHKEHGLLVEEGPYAFLKSMSIQMEMQSQTRIVTLPDAKGEPVVHRIPISGSAETSVVGSARGRSASQILRSAMSKSPSHERHKWFHDDTEGALKEIRRILSQVSQRLVIVDPYFSSTDVLRLLPWVARRMLTIELLTSSAGLAKMRSRSLENVGVEDSGDKKLIDVEWESKNLQELVEVYHQARFAQKVNLAEIRVMRGRRSPIHDRIIVADSTVWHLGSSLNEFGHRGTMLSNVGEHHDVMDTIVRVWDKSAPIQSRIDELASSLPHRKDRPSDEVR